MMKEKDASRAVELNDRRNIFAVNLGLGSNLVLAFLKVTFGIAGHSPALLADGINSSSDVVYYIAAKVFLHMSVKPADKEHPYGHRQMENIAAIVVGSFIITTAIAIFWNSIDLVYDIIIRKTKAHEAAHITFIIALFTVGLKTVLTAVTRSIGIKTKNNAIKALAYDHLNDIFASVAVAIGIFFSRLGHFWVDPLAGCIVALFILKTGIEIIRESAYGLMSTEPDEELKNIIETKAWQIPGITGVENIRVHTFGQFFMVNMDILLDQSLTISQGDAIADVLESQLNKEIHNLLEAHIHYHPDRREQ